MIQPDSLAGALDQTTHPQRSPTHSKAHSEPSSLRSPLNVCRPERNKHAYISQTRRSPRVPFSLGSMKQHSGIQNAQRMCPHWPSVQRFRAPPLTGQNLQLWYYPRGDTSKGSETKLSATLLQEVALKGHHQEPIPAMRRVTSRQPRAPQAADGDMRAREELVV